MVAHTGFLLTARRLAPGAIAPSVKRRASKSSYGDEDVEAWTPGAVGDREISDKTCASARGRRRRPPRGRAWPPHRAIPGT